MSRRTSTLDFARIGAFSGLVIVGTLLSNLLFGITLPYPLYEITAAPAFYMAISVLFSKRVSFWSTAIGSGIGEGVGIFLFGLAPGAFALSYVPGIIAARAPEALIINRFRRNSLRILTAIMVLATIFESVVFFAIDWPIYSFTGFYCPPNCTSSGLLGGFSIAVFDFATMVDIAWIPVSLAIVVAARKAFKTEFFD